MAFAAPRIKNKLLCRSLLQDFCGFGNHCTGMASFLLPLAFQTFSCRSHHRRNTLVPGDELDLRLLDELDTTPLRNGVDCWLVLLLFTLGRAA